MCSGFVGTYCRRNDSAAVHSVDTKTSTGDDDKVAVQTLDKISVGGDDKATVPTGDRISTGGDNKATVPTGDKISTGGDNKAAVPTGDKISTGDDDKDAVPTGDKISPSDDDKTAVQPLYKISIGGDDKAAVRSPERLSLRPVGIFACGKTLLLRPTLSNMSRCNHFFAVVMNPLFLIFLLVRPALSSFKGLRVRGSRFCCYRRFYDN